MHVHHILTVVVCCTIHAILTVSVKAGSWESTQRSFQPHESCQNATHSLNGATDPSTIARRALAVGHRLLSSPRSDVNHRSLNASNLSVRQVDPTKTWPIRGYQTLVASNQGYMNLHNDAMGEAWLLAGAALAGMGTPQAPSTSYLRYFRRNTFCNVQNAFLAMLGGLGGGEIPFNGAEEAKDVTVYWGEELALKKNPRLFNPTGCTGTHDLYAWSAVGVNLEDMSHSIIFCPFSLTDSARLMTFDCKRLAGRAMSEDFHTKGVTMLHEMIHWRYLGLAAVAERIRDFKPPVGQLPPSGYGPYNAMRVNNIWGRGTYNADNYAWFALEAFFLRDDGLGCGGTKMDPPLQNFYDPIPGDQDNTPFDDTIVI